MAQAAGYRTPRKQTLEQGGHEIQEEAEDEAATRLVPMMREYSVFNVDQCENLPDSVRPANRRAFAIPIVAMTLPTNFCARPAQTSARAWRSELRAEPGFYLHAGVPGVQGCGPFLWHGVP
jgi:hypothetical protein